MENPMSWSATQRLLNAAVYAENPGKATVELLRSTGLLVTHQDDDHQVEALINDEAVAHQAAVSTGVCGLSLVSTVYHKLIELGHISG